MSAIVVQLTMWLVLLSGVFRSLLFLQVPPPKSQAWIGVVEAFASRPRPVRISDRNSHDHGSPLGRKSVPRTAWHFSKPYAVRPSRSLLHSTPIKGPTPTSGKRSSSQRSTASSYGRGAEIWPPTNETPVRLEDSFPNGVIPDLALSVWNKALIQNPTKARQVSNPPKREPPQPAENIASIQRRIPMLSRRRVVPQAIARILRRAARSGSENSASTQRLNINESWSRAAFLLALAMLPLIRPIDMLLLSLTWGYFCILAVWARSCRSAADGSEEMTDIPNLPALPPQGHVPALVAYPLGLELTLYSWTFRTWRQVGFLLECINPFLLVALHSVFMITSHSGDVSAARGPGRALFWWACQVLSESIGRKAVLPLPLQILISVAFTTIRLGALWQWTFQSILPPRPSLPQLVHFILAGAQFLYTLVHLLAFLLPVGVMRYMRAHFFSVEAEQVVTRSGLEVSTLGLSS